MIRKNGDYTHGFRGIRMRKPHFESDDEGADGGGADVTFDSFESYLKYMSQ